MTITKKKAAAAMAAAGLAAVAPGIAPPVAAESPGDYVTFKASCTMTMHEAWMVKVNSTLDVTFKGRVLTDKRVLIYGVNYEFGPLKHYVAYWTPNSGLQWRHSSDQTPGDKNNFAFESPVTTKSGDNLPPSGYWNVPDFSTSQGSHLKIRGWADHRDAPDPSCAATTNASWSTK